MAEHSSKRDAARSVERPFPLVENEPMVVKLADQPGEVGKANDPSIAPQLQVQSRVARVS